MKNCNLKSQIKEKDETNFITEEFEKITRIDEYDEEIYDDKVNLKNKNKRINKEPFKNKINKIIK